MDDEFKLCWKNFQDNIASGFQNLYDRGDLVDVTLACDGKLLHAHKIVLAICSPYFQEIFITNPCKHPIIILKDVTFNIMCELLEFMYQGVVNVKHTELQSFMKIGQLLQIKGLATNASSTAGNSTTDKSASQTHNTDEASNACVDADNNSSGTAAKISLNRTASGNDDAIGTDGLSSVKVSNPISVKSHSPASSPSPMSFAESTANTNQQNFKSSPESNLPLHPNYHAASSLKRHADVNNDALSIYSRKQFRRSIASADHNTDHSDSADADAESDYFLPSLPHLASNSSAAAAAAAFRGTFNPAAFGFDYNLYKNSSAGGASGASGVGGTCGGNTPGGGSSGPEYPNDLHIPSDYSKNFANHVDIPPIAPGEHWFHGKLEFMLSQRGKPLLVHDGHTFGIQYVRKDKKYWQCNLSRKFNCKARVTTTDTGEIIVTNNEHCHTEIRQHLRKDYQRNKVMMNALLNLSTNIRRQSTNGNNTNNLNNLSNFTALATHGTSLLNAAATAAAMSGHGSASLQSFRNECLEQQQQHHTPGVVDFTKDRGTISPPRITPNIHNQPIIDEHVDTSRPLDCGFRQSTTTTVPNDFEKEINSRDSSYNGATWKCKNEIGDS